MPGRPDHQRKLILFTRFPEPGRVKTRLLPALDPRAATALHRRLVLRALRTALAACRSCEAKLQVSFDGGDEGRMRHWLGDSLAYQPQAGGDLGKRMARAFEESFRAGASAVVLIGSDCPNLTPEILGRAFEALDSHPVVLGPATDGGYYLVGLTRLIAGLFQDIPWGTDTVFADSLRALSRLGLKPALLETLADLDRPADLPAWQRLARAEEAEPPRISVIIPALNEAPVILPTVEAAQQGQPHQILVVDGGSSDATIALARNVGASVLTSQPGRARQMNAGAAAATGNLLLFLHADTLLPAAWPQVIFDMLRLPNVVAGAFSFRVAGNFPGRRLLEWGTNWRSRARQMPYGDQGLFLRQGLFDELGGFADLSIMEDYDFVRRLRHRGRVLTAGAAILTSARRWQSLGLVRATLTNQLLVAAYHLGVQPRTLARWYRRAKSSAR
jgi:rSAM/selenodomain-associated transferase 2/rSAM/selenodomain-associated transferase 1